MTIRVLRLLVCTGAAGIPLLLASSALAYTVGSGSSGSAPTSAAGGSPFTFTATFIQPDGTPFPAGLTVTFSQSSGPSAAAPAVTLFSTAALLQVGTATFNPTTSTTNSAGAASTTVTLPAGFPGQYVLAATVAGGGTVTATVTEAGGFPNTTASSHQTAGVAWPVAAGTTVLLLVLAALGIGLWRVRRPGQRSH